MKLPRLSIVFIIVELKIDQYNYTDKTDNISQIVNISDIDSRISVLKNLKISWPQDEPLLGGAGPPHDNTAALLHSTSTRGTAENSFGLVFSELVVSTHSCSAGDI